MTIIVTGPKGEKLKLLFNFSMYQTKTPRLNNLGVFVIYDIIHF